MAKLHQREVQPDDIDLGAQLSETRYSAIEEISGFVLRKPIEYALYGPRSHSQKERFMAVHYLPALHTEKPGEGLQLYGLGETEVGARDRLVALIVGLHNDYQGFRETAQDVSPEVELQRKYLECLMSKQE